MKGGFKKIQRRGLPGGPNEMFSYITGVFSTQGYKFNSPDYNNPFNIIPSNKITMKEDDGSPLKKGPIMAVDNYGNKKIMLPGNDYQFPGDYVIERPFDSYAFFEGVSNEGNLSGGFGVSNDKFGASVFGMTPYSKEDRKYFKGMFEPTLTYRPKQNLDINFSTEFQQNKTIPKIGLKYRFLNGGEPIKPTLYVNPNDPEGVRRYNAYQDSLALTKAPYESFKIEQVYDNLLKQGKYEEAKKFRDNRVRYNIPSQKAFERLSITNNEKPEPIRGSRTGWGLDPSDPDSPRYKKPVQPVEYKTPEVGRLEMRTMVKKPDYNLPALSSEKMEEFEPLKTSPGGQTVLQYNPETGKHEVKEVRTQEDAFWYDNHDGWIDNSQRIVYYNPETKQYSDKPFVFQYKGMDQKYKFQDGGQSDELPKAQSLGEVKSDLFGPNNPLTAFTGSNLEYERQYVKDNFGNPNREVADKVFAYMKLIEEADAKDAQRKEEAYLKKSVPVSDKTKVETGIIKLPSPQEMIAADQRAKAKKEEQEQFEKEVWQDYSKMSTGEKALDRVQAFMVDPFGMTARFITGDQAYIPGMGRGLLNHDNPNYENYLRAVGYTPGQFEAYDLGHMVNPMYWGASIGNNINKGNYGTAAVEGALTFAPFLPKGTISMGNVSRGTRMLADDFTRAGNYLTETPLRNVYKLNPKASKEVPLNTLYHGSNNPNLQFDDIIFTDVNPNVGARPGQFKQRALASGDPLELPGGFYTNDLSTPKFMGNFDYRYSMNIPANAKVFKWTSGISDNISVKKLQELKNKGYDIIEGKNVLGQTEYIPLNKDIISNWKKFEAGAPELEAARNIRFKTETPHWLKGYPKQLSGSSHIEKQFGLSIDELNTKGIVKKLKDVEKNVDLGIGKYDHTNLIEYENGLQLHTYSKPGSKVDDVILVFDPKTNENIAYMRKYLKGDFPSKGGVWEDLPTNEWHIKADMPTVNKDLVKFANKELEKIVQVKPIKYESNTISTDGLRYWNQQQKHGYSGIDDFTTPSVSAAGKDDLFKNLKYSNDDNAFEAVKFATKEDAIEGAARLENLMKNQGLDYKVIINNDNTLKINLPKLQRAYYKGGPVFQDGGEEKDPEPETMQEVNITPLTRFYGEYNEKNPFRDYLINEKYDYIKKGNKGLQNIFNVNEKNFPEKAEQRIIDRYNYNRNNYVIEQYAKENNIDLTDRESIMNNPANAKVLSKAMENSKYGKYLQPTLWARTKAGAVSAANALLDGPQGIYGPRFTPDIKGLTPKEEAEYYYPNGILQKIGNVADVFSFVDIVGAPLMNQLTDNRDYAENPSTLGELASGTLNARTSPMAASVPSLVLAPTGLYNVPDLVSTSIRGLGKVGKYADDAAVALVNAGKKSKQLPGSPNAASVDDVGEIFYHGSPWKWDKYDPSTVGKAEGASKRGVGLNLFPEHKYFNAPKFANIKSSDAPIHLGKGKPLTEAEKISINPTIYEFTAPKDFKLKNMSSLDFKKGYNQEDLIKQGYDGIRTDRQVTVFPESVHKLKMNKQYSIDDFVKSKPNTEWNPWSTTQKTYINKEGRTVFNPTSSVDVPKQLSDSPNIIGSYDDIVEFKNRYGNNLDDVAADTKNVNKSEEIKPKSDLVDSFKKWYKTKYFDKEAYNSLQSKQSDVTKRFNRATELQKAKALEFNEKWRQPERELYLKYKKYFDEATEESKKASEGLDQTKKYYENQLNNVSKQHQEQVDEVIKTSTSFDEATVKIKKIDEEYDNIVAEIKREEDLKLEEYTKYFEENNKYLEDIQEEIVKTSADPDFRDKVEFIRSQTGGTEKALDPQSSNLLEFPDTKARSVGIKIDRDKGPESLFDDLEFFKLNIKDQVYLLNEFSKIGGTNSSRASISFIETPKIPSTDELISETPFSLNPKKLKKSYGRSLAIAERKLLSDYEKAIKDYGETVAHEGGHDSQKYMNWLNRLQKYDKEYAYKIARTDSDLSKLMADVLVEPVKKLDANNNPIRSYETWLASIGEVHSSLDELRFRTVNHWLKNGKIDSIEEGIEILKGWERTGKDSWYEYLVDQLKDHFKADKSFDAKKTVLQMLPSAATLYLISKDLVQEEQTPLQKNKYGGESFDAELTPEGIKESISQGYKVKEDPPKAINFEGLKKGIAHVESADGKLMINPDSTATGLYGQRFSEIKNTYKGTREDFAKDLDYQNELFKKRFYEGLPETQTTPLEKDAYDLYDKYSAEIKDFSYSLEDIAALSNFLGRQGTRMYLGYVVRDGKTLAEVFPDKYGADAKQANKTPEEYLAKIRPFYIETKSKGGEILKVYADYINGMLDDTPMFKEGGRIYDKLNRIYYKDAKELGMSSPNYIMTYLVNR